MTATVTPEPSAILRVCSASMSLSATPFEPKTVWPVLCMPHSRFHQVSPFGSASRCSRWLRRTDATDGSASSCRRVAPTSAFETRTTLRRVVRSTCTTVPRPASSRSIAAALVPPRNVTTSRTVAFSSARSQARPAERGRSGVESAASVAELDVASRSTTRTGASRRRRDGTIDLGDGPGSGYPASYEPVVPVVTA
jgi:hypothetical protein